MQVGGHSARGDILPSDPGTRLLLNWQCRNQILHLQTTSSQSDSSIWWYQMTQPHTRYVSSERDSIRKYLSTKRLALVPVLHHSYCHGQELRWRTANGPRGNPHWVVFERYVLTVGVQWRNLVLKNVHKRYCMHTFSLWTASFCAFCSSKVTNQSGSNKGRSKMVSLVHKPCGAEYSSIPHHCCCVLRAFDP